ncbi:dirigent protein 1-like [Zingiber officinale]|uniref:dirigent protein 1-like n=1 Tax=Zingiber officinale TaxID=94328 RepID=UPI001C4D98FA|nr:dirigent protein 1-like [Zingiber officinale]
MTSIQLLSFSFLFLFITTIFVVAAGRHHHHHAHHLRLYVHNNTAVLSLNLHKPRNFGDLVVFDNVLRLGRHPSSPQVGSMQGLGVSSDMTDATSTTMFNIVFTGGQHNGSSIAVFGVFRSADTSDWSIIGGSGEFRQARGYVLNRQVVNPTTTMTARMDAYVTFY